MVSPHLEIPTLATAVNDLPTLMDDQTNLLDQALQGDVDFVVTAGGTIVISKTISLRNFFFNLTGTPSADFNLDFPINNRYFAINNKSGKKAMIRIDGGGGMTVSVLDGQMRILYIDGADVINVTGAGAPSQETLVIRGTDFAIMTADLTPIDWNNETRDEGNWHDNSTDPEQIKVGEGIFDAVAKIHITDFDTNETMRVKVQRYNSSDALQETLAEDNREHDGAVDMVFNLSVINIRAAAGDYLTVEVKSEIDTNYKVEADDSYFLVRTAAGVGSSGGGGSDDVQFTKVELTSNEVVSANAAVVWDQVRSGELKGTVMWVVGNPTRLTADGNGVYMWGFHGDTLGISIQLFPGIFKNGVSKSVVGNAESLTRIPDPGGGSALFDVLGGGILSDTDYIEAVAHNNTFTIENVTKTSFWLMKVSAT